MATRHVYISHGTAGLLCEMWFGMRWPIAGCLSLVGLVLVVYRWLVYRWLFIAGWFIAGCLSLDGLVLVVYRWLV